MKRVLIVEDERGIAEAIAKVAGRLGHETKLCGTVSEGRSAMARERFDAAVLDVGLPDGKGIQLLPKLAEAKTAVAVITARGDLGDAVQARRDGAEIYLPKPLRLKDVELVLEQLLRPRETTADLGSGSTGDLLGHSAPMQRVYSDIARACMSDVVVLISGPTGSGKTAAAEAIHRHSERSAKPFRVLHCQALPETLLESELFGYERGAFTGATGSREGLLERANGGTLLLDEVGDLPPAAQAKLLRVLEEGVFMRVGGREEISVDLRVITATHRNLAEEVAEGRFREDLYYRLRVLEVRMPSLKERPEDIPELANAFLMATDSKAAFSADVLALLSRHDWPGNVRELRNAVQAAAASCNSDVILREHLPGWLPLAERADGEEADLERLIRSWLSRRILGGAMYKELSDDLERIVLNALLERYDGRPTVLARALGMNRVTLRSRLRNLGLWSLPEPENPGDSGDQ